MIVLIVSGVVGWGVVVGAVLMYLTGARYARELHERIAKLETTEEPSTAVLDRIETRVMGRVSALLAERELGDDDVRVTH